jgi:hypothetical protein
MRRRTGRNIMETNEETDIVANTALGFPIFFVILCSTSYALSVYSYSEKYRHLGRTCTHKKTIRRCQSMQRHFLAIGICTSYADACLVTATTASRDDHKRETGPTINPPGSRQQPCGSTSASQAELFKGAQLAFGLHDDAIQAYGRAVSTTHLGKLMLMSSRKQRPASTHGRCVCRQS